MRFKVRLTRYIALITIFAITNCGVILAETGEKALQGNYPTISAKSNYSLFIKKDGSLWGFGGSPWNSEREVIGIPLNIYKPVKLMDDVISVSSCNYSVLVIKNDGSLWSFGSNRYGQLGDGTDIDKIKPVKVMDDVVSVSTGSFNVAAVKKDGSLWTWGLNLNGEIGDGTLKDRLKPVKIMEDVVSAEYGFYHGLAIKRDGSLWGWGSNVFGVLGISDDFEAKQSPIKIMEDVISISAGAYHSMAIKKDGSLWGWGFNEYDQVGDSVKNGWSVTTPIKLIEDISFVSAGVAHTMAIKTDGSLWAWGYNESGRLGDGSNKNKNNPVKIMENVAIVSAGDNNTMAVKQDGSLWIWGNNDFGQIGDGTVTIYNSNKLIILEDYNKYSPVIAAEDILLPLKAVQLKELAIPTSSKILVDGNTLALDVYLINNNNYFKLRDLAMVLSGTVKEFEVVWDSKKNAINLITNKSYTAVGGELNLASSPTSKEALPTTSRLYLNGQEADVQAFNIGGNNYYKLRDIGKIIDFGTTWDANTKSIIINSTTNYSE